METDSRMEATPMLTWSVTKSIKLNLGWKPYTMSPTGVPEGFCLQNTRPQRVTEKQQQQMTSILCDCSLSPLQHNSFGGTTPPANNVWSSSRRRPSPTTGATDAAGTTHW